MQIGNAIGFVRYRIWWQIYIIKGMMHENDGERKPSMLSQIGRRIKAKPKQIRH